MSRRTETEREKGQAALEYVGVITLLLTVALAAIQVGLAAYAVQQAGTGARAAARTASYRDAGTDPAAAGQAAMSDWLGGQVSVAGGEGSEQATATATVPVPSILPLFDFGNAVRSATMPVD